MKISLQMKLNHKLTAGALYYSIAICLIISIITSSLLLLTYLFKKENAIIDRQEKVLMNHDSGWELALSSPFDFPQTRKFYLNEDSVMLVRKPWGLFDLIGIKAGKGMVSKKSIAFVGEQANVDSLFALVLEDRNRPLSLCGKTRIRGNCKLPKAGVKRAYIEGQTYSGEKLIYGTYVANKAGLTKYKRILALPDSFLSLPPSPEEIDSAHSFWEEPITTHLVDAAVLEGETADGNMVYVSQGSVVVESGASVHDCIVAAPVVRIGEGFTGALQVFATDSIIVEGDVTLEYPSALVVSHTSLAGGAHIIIKDSSTISGAIFSYSANTGSSDPSLTVIEKGAVVVGQVVCNNSIDHKGKIYGSVSTSRFLLGTPSAVYENHLLNAIIDSESLSEYYVFPHYTNTNPQKAIMKWLY